MPRVDRAVLRNAGASGNGLSSGLPRTLVLGMH